MAEKLKEIEELDNLRNKITKLSEFISGGSRIREYIAKNPMQSVIIIVLIGISAAFLSGRIIKFVLKSISFALKVAAFLYVVRDSYEKVVKIIKNDRSKAVLTVK